MSTEKEFYIETDELVAMVLRLQRGETAVEDEIYKVFRRKVHGQIHKKVNDFADAKSIMHDVFIEIGKKIGLLRKPEAFVTWCNRIVNAKCDAYLRKKYREKKRQEKPPKISKEEKYTRRKLDDQEKKLLASIIDAFPAKQAEAMSMHYIDGDTIEIIANKLGVPEGTVKSRLYYGRKAFEKIVKK